jgi:protein FrlC
MNFSQSSAVYFNHSLEFAIRDLHRLGYEGIEVWGGRPHMYRHDLDAELDDIVGLLKKLGMQVSNFIPAQFRYPSILCSSNEVVRKDSVEYIKTSMDNAAKIGAPSVSLCPGMMLFDQDVRLGWNQLVKSLKEIEEYSRHKNLYLYIEPAHRFESNLILTAEDCFRMLKELQSDRFGVLLDTGHVNLNGEHFDEIIPKCKGLLLHIHIDDNCGDADSHLIPGKGTVDFASLCNALKKIDYTGFISAELGSVYDVDPTRACAETLQVLKALFEEREM